MLLAVFGAAVVVVPAALPRAQGRVSVASPRSRGVPANERSGNVGGISADGRYVAFASRASNLVVGDTNKDMDVFVRDRVAGKTERVSVSSGGAQANAGSLFGVISGDGRFVAFQSDASNLVAGDTNDLCDDGLGGHNCTDVFVRDRIAKTTERVSVSSGGAQANGGSEVGSLSADGRYVTFDSGAPNLVPGDTNSAGDTFVRDRATGTTERVSVSADGAQANAGSGSGVISDDGRFVAFGSDASNLVAGDTNGAHDVFVRDRVAGTTERLSVTAAAGRDIYLRSISSDGRYVAVEAEDPRASYFVYVIDRVTHTSELVSVNSSGEPIGAGSDATLSRDGRFVAFVAEKDFVDGDIFLRDRLRETTARISINGSGKGGNAGSDFPGISADGRYVAFESDASNLVAGDTNLCDNGTANGSNCTDVFLRDRVAHKTTLISVGRRQAPPMQHLLLQPWPPRAGRALSATARVGDPPGSIEDGLLSVVGARVSCTATVAGRKLEVSQHSYRFGVARCGWKVPDSARGEPLKGSLKVTTSAGAATQRFTGTVR